MKLLDLRHKYRLSQFEVAQALGIPQTTYSGYETGKRNPTPEMLCAMADYFNVSIDMLLERTPLLFDDARTERPQILEIYEKLPQSKKEALLEYAAFLASGNKY